MRKEDFIEADKSISKKVMAEFKKHFPDSELTTFEEIKDKEAKEIVSICLTAMEKYHRSKLTERMEELRGEFEKDLTHQNQWFKYPNDRRITVNYTEVFSWFKQKLIQ